MTDGCDGGSFTTIETLFHKALALEAGEREAFLRESCKGQPETLVRLHELLRVHEESAHFIEPPDDALGSPRPEEIGEVGHRRRIGSFQTVRMIASGGMGTVYEAIQDEPHRTVALKILRPEASSSTLRRFQQEAELLANLRHPGIAQIYDAGTIDEAPIPMDEAYPNPSDDDDHDD